MINLLILIISLLDYVLDSIGRSLDASSLSVFLVRRAKLVTQSNVHALPFDARSRARALKEKRECSQSRMKLLVNHQSWS